MKPNFSHPSHPHSFRGLSLFEVILVLAVVAILASGAFLAATRTHESIVSAKLQSDVTTINSSIQVYLASGGNLDGVTHPQAVIDKLKTIRTKATANQFAGLRREMIDQRLAVNLQTAAEAATNQGRAVWNPTETKFEIKTSGAPGVNFFFLKPELVEVDFGAEDRESSPIKYNQNDGWIWAYNDSDTTAGPTPTPVPVSGSGGSSGGSGSSGTGSGGSGSPGSGSWSGDSGSDSGDGGDSGDGSSGGDSGSGGSPNPNRLSPPAFSVSQAQHSFASFPFPLELTNPNPGGSSEIRYAINGGNWQTYTGAITVLPDTEIYAQAVSLNPALWSDSLVISQRYTAILDSLAGFVGGGFHSPVGPSTMEQSIVNQSSLATFHWGTTSYVNSVGNPVELGPQSSIAFTGSPFANVDLDTPFRVGDLTYYNGTILEGSGADQVNLRVSFDLVTPIQVSLPVDYTFELINTVNDDEDPQGSADFVRLTSQSGIVEQVIGGIRYEVELFFGNSSSQGYTTLDQFHVLENEQASAELFAVVRAITDLSDVELASFVPGGDAPGQLLNTGNKPFKKKKAH